MGHARADDWIVVDLDFVLLFKPRQHPFGHTLVEIVTADLRQPSGGEFANARGIDFDNCDTEISRPKVVDGQADRFLAGAELGPLGLPIMCRSCACSVDHAVDHDPRPATGVANRHP